jgi:hypothetical protein
MTASGGDGAYYDANGRLRKPEAPAASGTTL